MKKRIWFLFMSLLFADEMQVKSFGALGGLYNQGVGSSHSYGNLMAHVGAEFILENGWSFGLGAIGGWNVFNATKTTYGDLNYSGIGDGGDISDAFAHYKNSRLEFALGRFNTNFVDFDYISGNIQGGSVKVIMDNITYWGIFMDSMLLTGSHKNTTFGLYGTNIIGGYYPTSKKNILGTWGEVFALGLKYQNSGFDVSAFSLLDTQLPVNALPDRNTILFQIGGEVSYTGAVNDNWGSETKLRGIFQLGNTSKLDGKLLDAKDAVAGLIWLDQNFTYKIFNMGVGVYGVLSSSKNGGIYTFSDPSRFYGKIINQPLDFPSPYFSEQVVSGYLFGGIDLKKSQNMPIKIDGIISFGSYTEYSLIVDYNVWKKQNMQFDFGMGYVYSQLRQASASNSLLFFGKFYY